MMYLGKDAVAIAKETGARFVKGSFTVPNEGSSIFRLDFGKTFSKYILFIEADSTSKQTILDSGINASRAYALTAIYPTMQIGENTAYKYVYNRVHPVNKTVSVDGNNNGDLYGDYATITAASLSGTSTNGAFKGLTYNTTSSKSNKGGDTKCPIFLNE